MKKQYDLPETATIMEHFRYGLLLLLVFREGKYVRTVRAIGHRDSFTDIYHESTTIMRDIEFSLSFSLSMVRNFFYHIFLKSCEISLYSFYARTKVASSSTRSKFGTEVRLCNPSELVDTARKTKRRTR